MGGVDDDGGPTLGVLCAHARLRMFYYHVIVSKKSRKVAQKFLERFRGLDFYKEGEYDFHRLVGAFRDPDLEALTTNLLQELVRIINAVHPQRGVKVVRGRLSANWFFQACFIVLSPVVVFGEEEFNERNRSLYTEAEQFISSIEEATRKLVNGEGWRSVGLEDDLRLGKHITKFLRDFKSWKLHDEPRTLQRMEAAMVGLEDATKTLSDNAVVSCCPAEPSISHLFGTGLSPFKFLGT